MVEQRSLTGGHLREAEIYSSTPLQIQHPPDLDLVVDLTDKEPRLEIDSRNWLTARASLPNATRLQLMTRRILDVMTASVLMVALSPLLLVAALAVRLTSPGPILFRQTRAGKGGREFTLYKFRSMYVEAEEEQHELLDYNEVSGPVFKIREDPRLTRVGRLLRRSSIDELPQLWNVVRGDMCLVGPRPPIPDEVEHYTDWERQRLKVKPGITCIWQVSGRSELDFETWVKMDIEYIENWSLWLDLKLLARTIPAVISGRGAY